MYLLLATACLFANGAVLYPGQPYDIVYEPTTGEYGPTWSCDNPTLRLSSVGFLCHVTAQGYFSGTATVTCSYKDQIGSSSHTRTRKWTFTCIDTKISISPVSKSIKVDESFQITCSYDRSTYLTPSVQFTGYDNNVVSVSDNGLVRGKSAGTTKIYVKSNIGTNSAICSVNVGDAGAGGGVSGGESAYDDWDSSGTTLITLTEPGTLAEYIAESQKYTIKNLTIVGPLNGSDLRLLRDMAGQDQDKQATNGQLETIDLKDALFVSGGAWYVKSNQDYLYTSDEPVMPKNAFAWIRRLKRIRFPKYCTVLTNNALLQCQSLEQISIPAGVTKLDYGSLNGGYANMPLQVLYLPASMTAVEASVYRCENLTDIYCYATNPPSIKYPSSFESSTNIKNGTLYVPKGCAQAYWNADGWRLFKEIKETLDVYGTLYIRVGANGAVKYDDKVVYRSYPIAYSGNQAFEVLSSELVDVEIIPDEGYEVSKILLNGNIVTLEHTRQSYHLGKIDKQAVLEVEFGKSSDIDEIISDMKGKIEVYNLSGKYIGSFFEKEELEKLPKGFYIVKIGQITEKVLKK